MPPSKKRKAPSAEKAEKGWSQGSKGGKLGFTSYEDIADEEDAFHLQRDRVLLDAGDGPDAKRRRKIEAEGAFLFFPFVLRGLMGNDGLC